MDARTVAVVRRRHHGNGIVLIGLDTCLSILEVLYDGFKDPKYRPCPLWREKVDSGHLGRKSGRGFFDYAKPARCAVRWTIINAATEHPGE